MKPRILLSGFLSLASSIAALAFAAAPQALGQSNWTYNGTVAASTTAASNQWNNPLSWSGGVPDFLDAIANFTLSTTSARTITLNGDRTVGTLAIDDPTTAYGGYTVSAGPPCSLILTRLPDIHAEPRQNRPASRKHSEKENKSGRPKIPQINP